MYWGETGGKMYNERDQLAREFKGRAAGVKLRVIADDVSVMVLGTSPEHR